MHIYMHTYRQECFVTAFCKVLGYGTQRHLGCKNQAAECIVLRAAFPPVLLNFFIYLLFKIHHFGPTICE